MSIVKKLDDPARFAKIPEPPKTKPTTAHQKDKVKERISVWYNVFKANNMIDVDKSKTETSWIAKNYDNIHKWILTTYGNEEVYSPNTLRNHLEGLANTLLHIDKYKYKEIVRPIFNEALAVQKKIDANAEDSLLSDKEVNNFVHYPEIVRERDRLAKHLETTPNDKKTNIYHLILSINTYIPPLRLDWIGMKFWPLRVKDGKIVKVTDAMRKTPAPTKDADSYLYEYIEGHWAIVINNDKVSKYHKEKFDELHKMLSEEDKKDYERFTYKLDDDIIQEKPKYTRVTDGKELNKIINNSLKYWARNYVLPAVKLNNEPMGETSYASAFRTLFSDPDNPRQPTQNLIRKMYINHWYEHYNLSEKTKVSIALRMRHSTKIASKAYRKINVPDIKGNFEGYTPKVMPTVLESLPRKKTERFNPKEYSKVYRSKNKENIEEWRKEFYNANKDIILARKQLDLLNKGLVSNPTEHSKTTYGLKYDDDKKQWVSDLVNKTNIIKIETIKDGDTVETPKVVTTRSKTKELFGEGKKIRQPNIWLHHVKKIQKENPDMNYKQILSLASTTYIKIDK